MKHIGNGVIHWTPRVLTILFALFISMFAMDVFGEGRGFWETALALLMHLIPTIFIVAVLIASWRWPWIGGIIFPLLAALYVYWAWGKFPAQVYITMAGPLLLIAVLFLLDWRREAHEKTKPGI
jgi:hypothetical protein